MIKGAVRYAVVKTVNNYTIKHKIKHKIKRSAIVNIRVCGSLIIPQPAIKPRKFNCLFIKAITTYNQYKTVSHIVCILDSDATGPRSDDLSKQ